MNKSYSRINWEDYPSQATAINETNLNRMDAALNDIDDKTIELDIAKATKEEVSTAIVNIELNEGTGVFTVTRKNGSKFTIDTLLEKIAINFNYDESTQKIVIHLDDGTTREIDLSALITQYEFMDTDTVSFLIGTDGSVSAIVKDGSITEDKLEPNYLAKIKIEVENAKLYASNAKTSEGNADYDAKLAQSYSVGGSGVRDGEDTDNARYYKEQAGIYASNANDSASTAEEQADIAVSSAESAKNSEENAKISETNAKNNETASLENANKSEEQANISAEKASEVISYAESSAINAANAKESEENAKASELSAIAESNNAKNSADDALNYANSASASDTSAANSANTATTQANIAQNYAIGSTDSAKYYYEQAEIAKNTAEESAEIATTKAEETVQNAEIATEKATESLDYARQSEQYAIGESNSAKYYYGQTKAISESFSGAIKPMGTVLFSELPSLSEAGDGWMYNISNSFTTTVEFKEGAGNIIPAGSNVYKTSDGYWDVLAGSPVSGVKGENEAEYRRGNVNITKENVGLGKVANVATNDQTPSFTQAGTRENISSGEKLSTIFGKIMKFFSDLKTVAFTGSYADLLNKPTDATTSSSGFLSAEDKVKLDGVESGAQANSVTGVKGNAESSYRTGDINITPDNIGALSKTGDSKDNTASFTSADSTTEPSWTDVPKLESGEKHSLIFNKISTMFKNIRYLYNILGTTDISAIGDGTATGAIARVSAKVGTGKPSEYTYDSSLNDIIEITGGDENLVDGLKSAVTALTSYANESLSGKQDGIKSCSNTDFNTIKTSGWYYGYTGMTNAKFEGSISVLEVIAYSGDWIIQRQTLITSSFETWERTYYSGNAWSAWYKKLTTRNIADNLTNTSTSDALSANQGKVLKGLVDGKAASGHGHDVATTSANGFMSAGDKTKLNHYPYAHYSTQSANGGYYKIKINSTTNWMLCFTIRLYQSYRATDIMIGGYNYSGSNWYLPTATILGDSSNTDIIVYFGYDSAASLWVAVPASSYTGLDIFNVTNGYTQIGSYENLFSITNVSSLATTQHTITASAPSKNGHTHNYAGSSSAGGAATNAEQLGGMVPSAPAANSTIVARTPNGYIHATYFNQSSGSESASTSSYIMFCNSDGYLRKGTLSSIKTALGLGTAAYTASTAYAAASHTHSYLPLSGGTLTGQLTLRNGYTKLADSYIQTSQDRFYVSTNGAAIGLNNANVYCFVGDKFIPSLSNSSSLGSSSYLWKQLYAATTAISTSDRTLKDNITPLTDIHKQFFMKLTPVSFTFIDGTSGRTHIGFISQDVEEAMQELGMTSLDFAGFCKDVRIKVEIGEAIVLDEDGNVVLDDEGNVMYTICEKEVPDLDENGNEQYIYSLRYEEFIALNTYMIQDTINEMNDVKSEISNLRNEINELKKLIID